MNVVLRYIYYTVYNIMINMDIEVELISSIHWQHLKKYMYLVLYQ